jgi:hypothetical protein
MSKLFSFQTALEHVMSTRKFWPLDYDPDGEIYENVAWDLPGFRRRLPAAPKRTGRRSTPRMVRKPGCEPPAI